MTAAGTRIEAALDAVEEVDAARASGLAEHDVTAAAVFAHARNGDVERAAALVAEIVEAEPLWRPAFERYERAACSRRASCPRSDDRIADGRSRSHSTSRAMPSRMR